MSVVRKASDADFGRLCRTAMYAFADSPMMRWFWPDDDEYFAGEGNIMRAVFRRWLMYDATFTTDDVVAVAAFVPPGRPTLDVPPEPEPIPIPPELMNRFVAIGTAIHEHTPAEPHWYLNMLGTHPHWQRQGLGSLVMSPITELCDRDGLAIYLETETVANVAYYSHLGFTVRSEWDLPLDGPHMWGMIRQPPQQNPVARLRPA